MRRSSLILVTALILVACNKTPADTSTVLQTDTIRTITKTNDELVDPIHGTEESFSYGAISGVDGNSANGVGYRYGFSDGATVITLNLNVPITKGSYYIGWLTQDDSSKDWIKMGDFFAPFNDARHGLKFESMENLTNYKNVMVTQEQSQNPATPGKIVAAGALTIVKPPVPLKKPTQPPASKATL
ncbi:MAG: hypothetical protein KBD00_02580 [Candidatus Peribacteraceae bacterium]|nr:hypothetical protein [Candidatus Peribacteraceae bacterium]